MCARSNLKGLKRYLVHLTKNAIIIKTIFYAGILENYFSQMKREKKTHTQFSISVINTKLDRRKKRSSSSFSNLYRKSEF